MTETTHTLPRIDAPLAERLANLDAAIRIADRGELRVASEALRAMRRVRTYYAVKATGAKARPPWCECPRCPKCGSATVVVDVTSNNESMFACSARCGPLDAGTLSRGQKIKAERAQWCWDVARLWGLG